MHERSPDFTSGRTPVAAGTRADASPSRGLAPAATAASGASFSARRQLAAASALVVLAFVVMQPASSASLGGWAALAFHALHVFPASLAAYVLSAWLFGRRWAARWPAWALLALAGALAGAALAPWSVTLELLFGVVDATDGAAAPMPATFEAWRQELADEILTVPLKTGVLWPAMNMLVLWRTAGIDRHAGVGSAAVPGTVGPPAEPAVDGAPRAAGADATTATPPTAPQPPVPSPAAADAIAAPRAAGWIDRLPARLGRDIVHLEAQEHYLRVVTTRGSHLMLQGFANAVADLREAGIDGVQVHRSRWVAWDHVARVDARARVLALWLQDGTRLPIGRRRARDVADGWARRGGDAG